MTRHAFLTPAARRDLAEHAAFIAQDSPDSANRLLDATRVTVNDLARMPRLGRSWLSSHPALAHVRVVPVPGFTNYLVFYRPIRGGIEVLRFLHGSQDIAALLEGGSPESQ